MNHEGEIVQEDGEISPPGEQYGHGTAASDNHTRESEREWDRNKERDRTRRRSRYLLSD